jgi:hypothetical protein
VKEEDYKFNLLQVKNALTEMAESYPLLPGLVYTSPYDFLLQHGKDYRPSEFKGELRTQKECYANSIICCVFHKYRYIEGITLAPDGQLLMHAWNIKSDGTLHDSTWANTGLVYIGVEFSVERADDATWNGDACVLNDEHRDYPIFHQRWVGENYNLIWPQSDRIDALHAATRTGQYIPPPSVTEWLEQKKV